jgi:hypothetical protein
LPVNVQSGSPPASSCVHDVALTLGPDGHAFVNEQPPSQPHAPLAVQLAWVTVGPLGQTVVCEHEPFQLHATSVVVHVV